MLKLFPNYKLLISLNRIRIIRLSLWWDPGTCIATYQLLLWNLIVSDSSYYGGLHYCHRGSEVMESGLNQWLPLIGGQYFSKMKFPLGKDLVQQLWYTHTIFAWLIFNISKRKYSFFKACGTVGLGLKLGLYYTLKIIIYAFNAVTNVTKKNIY